MNFVIPDAVFDKAKAMGISGSIETVLTNMASNAIPFFYKDFNRRFESMLFDIEDGTIYDIEKIDLTKPVSLKDVGEDVKFDRTRKYFRQKIYGNKNNGGEGFKSKEKTFYPESKECTVCKGYRTLTHYEECDYCKGKGCSSCRYHGSFLRRVPCKAQNDDRIKNCSVQDNNFNR